MSKKLSFKNALSRAGKILQDKDLSLRLIEKAKNNLSSKQKVNSQLKSAKKILGDYIRLLKFYVNGKYKDVSWKTIVFITAILIYFVTPTDIIPDFLPITGLVDDATLAVWLYQQVSVEMEKFLLWESNNYDKKNGR